MRQPLRNLKILCVLFLIWFMSMSLGYCVLVWFGVPLIRWIVDGTPFLFSPTLQEFFRVVGYSAAISGGAALVMWIEGIVKSRW